MPLIRGIYSRLAAVVAPLLTALLYTWEQSATLCSVNAFGVIAGRFKEPVLDFHQIEFPN